MATNFKLIKNHKFALIVLGVIIVTALVLRIISPEDNWVCQQGVWVKHGQPRAAQPIEACPGALENPSGNSPVSGSPDNLVGADRDAHGCIGSAGYSWCEAKQKCLRIWEETCASLTPATTSSSSTLITALQPKIVKPQAEALITSPYEVSGLAPGNWFFEASLPVRLYDNNGRLIMATAAQALSDWMTTDYVPFSARLVFATTASSGYLIIAKDNPSALPQNEAEYKIPVKFK